ncbi:MAG TPA: hypothetical protein VGB68_19865 [Pyrinomonadaceae bacterium]|jgi:hypothetical protein
MRKITCALAAIFTFFLGAAIYSAFLSLAVDKTNSLIQPLENSSAPIVSLSEATSNPEFYKISDIRVRANFYVENDGDNVGIFGIGKSGDYKFAGIEFRNDRGILIREELTAETRRLIERLKEKDSKDLKAFAEVEILGELHEQSPQHYCLKPRFYMAVKEIRQVSPLKTIDFAGKSFNCK